MQIVKVDDLIGGWFVGAFSPTAYHTTACEVSYKTHYAGETWAAHYHKLGDEINYLIEGRMEINGEQLEGPVVFVIPKGEVSAPVFHTDVKLVVVKVPGEPNDKYIVDN
jgi:quercetin dioxygenase-like cupin family protein